ncbi:MAG: enoyl-CoA hydratase-related protein [Phycicoccus sp.]
MFTGTGAAWIDEFRPASFAVPVDQWPSDLVDEHSTDSVKALERLVRDIDVPTIGAINGPGPRQELALLCDLTVCADRVTFADGNFAAGSVPGDGLHLVLAEVLGRNGPRIWPTPAQVSTPRRPWPRVW